MASSTSPSLVVGTSGTIGAALFSHLQNIRIPVYGTSHRYPISPSSPDSVAIHLNLLDDPNTWQLPNTPIDVAYLCAGVCRMALCEDDPITTSQVNIIGMQALIQRLIANKTFIVFLSTNQVFSGDTSYVLPHADYQPRNEYGRQKVTLEQWLQTNCSHYAIVRLTKVVEPNMALINNWIKQLQRHEPINAFTDMALAPVSLQQVIDTLFKIGQAKRTGIYHISGEIDISYFELANYLAAQHSYSPALIQPISALDAGIKKTFLPRFTTLDCSSTIAIGGEKPPHFSDVMRVTTQ